MRPTDPGDRTHLAANDPPLPASAPGDRSATTPPPTALVVVNPGLHRDETEVLASIEKRHPGGPSQAGRPTREQSAPVGRQGADEWERVVEPTLASGSAFIGDSGTYRFADREPGDTTPATPSQPGFGAAGASRAFERRWTTARGSDRIGSSSQQFAESSMYRCRGCGYTLSGRRRRRARSDEVPSCFT